MTLLRMHEVMKAAVVAMVICKPALADGGIVGVFGPAVQTINHWTVHVKADPMTDKADCTALYDDKPNVQLSPTLFAVDLNGRGGLGPFYQTRYDDAPAVYHFSMERNRASGVLPIAENGGVHNSSGTMNVDGIAEIPADAKRLRVHASTLVGDPVDEDVDLSGLAQVQALFATKGCPSWEEIAKKLGLR